MLLLSRLFGLPMNSGIKDEAGRKLNLGAVTGVAGIAFFSLSSRACSSLTCFFFLDRRNRIKARTAPIARMIPTASPALPAVDIPLSVEEDEVATFEESEVLVEYV